MISKLSNDIYNWRSFDSVELNNVIKQFEKIPREEISKFYKPYFTNELVVELLKIGETYKEEADMSCNTISILGNIIVRYNVEATDEVFDFFIRFSSVKKVNCRVVVRIK